MVKSGLGCDEFLEAKHISSGTNNNRRSKIVLRSSINLCVVIDIRLNVGVTPRGVRLDHTKFGTMLVSRLSPFFYHVPCCLLVGVLKRWENWRGRLGFRF